MMYYVFLVLLLRVSVASASPTDINGGELLACQDEDEDGCSLDDVLESSERRPVLLQDALRSLKVTRDTVEEASAKDLGEKPIADQRGSLLLLSWLHRQALPTLASMWLQLKNANSDATTIPIVLVVAVLVCGGVLVATFTREQLMECQSSRWRDRRRPSQSEIREVTSQGSHPRSAPPALRAVAKSACPAISVPDFSSRMRQQQQQPLSSPRNVFQNPAACPFPEDSRLERSLRPQNPKSSPAGATGAQPTVLSREKDHPEQSHPDLCGTVATLCPELVVPHGSECTLLLPRIPPKRVSGVGQISLDDFRGQAVFQATFDTKPSRTSESRRIILSNANAQEDFGFCRDSGDPLSRRCFRVFTGSEMLFGNLRANNNGDTGFSLITKDGTLMSFTTDVRSGNTAVTDGQERLLALAEGAPTSEDGTRCIRIGPLVDVGLVVLCLLGIDLINFSSQ